MLIDCERIHPSEVVERSKLHPTRRHGISGHVRSRQDFNWSGGTDHETVSDSRDCSLVERLLPAEADENVTLPVRPGSGPGYEIGFNSHMISPGRLRL